jgi:hypothetical protein
MNALMILVEFLAVCKTVFDSFVGSKTELSPCSSHSMEFYIAPLLFTLQLVYGLDHECR